VAILLNYIKNGTWYWGSSYTRSWAIQPDKPKPTGLKKTRSEPTRKVHGPIFFFFDQARISDQARTAVLARKYTEDTAEFVKVTNHTKAQLLGHEKIPVHQGAGRKPFVLGEPLMWPELIDTLPTRMREFHQWYLKACAEGYIMLATRIKHTHFYRGMDDIWIDFDHFLFLFHQDALDKSLVSVWAM